MKLNKKFAKRHKYKRFTCGSWPRPQCRTVLGDPHTRDRWLIIKCVNWLFTAVLFCTTKHTWKVNNFPVHNERNTKTVREKYSQRHFASASGYTIFSSWLCLVSRRVDTFSQRFWEAVFTMWSFFFVFLFAAVYLCRLIKWIGY